MSFKKVIAAFTVLVMVLASVTAIVAYTPESESAALPDKGTVYLNIETGWDANAKELSKLGITNPSFWTKTDNGYKLTIENVKYTSNESPAILIFGNGMLTFDCKGINEIKCTGFDKENACEGIVSGNDYGGMCFTGDGVMKVVCSNKTARMSTAIMTEYLTVRGGCTLIANGTDVTPLPGKDASSVGIQIENGGSIVITEGATVIAEGGDVVSNGDIVGGLTSGIVTTGQASGNVITIRDSTLISIGGDIKGGDTPVAQITGASLLSGDVYMENSIVRFYGGTADVKKSGEAFSIALMIQGKCRGINSEFVASSGDVSITSRHSSMDVCLQYSVGVLLFMDETEAFTMEGCDCYIVSGSCTATETGTNFYQTSAAFVALMNNTHTDFTMKLKNTIMDFEAGSAMNSYGFVSFKDVMKEESSTSKIVLDDADMWANGATKGVVGIIEITGTPKWQAQSNDGLDWKTLAAPYDKYVSIGFKNNVYIYADYNGLIAVHSYRVEGNQFTLPECEFVAPEGKHFKCWSIDGEEYQPGDIIYVNYYATVNAVWEGEPEPAPSSNVNVQVIVCIVAFILVIIALIGVILYERYS